MTELRLAVRSIPTWTLALASPPGPFVSVELTCPKLGLKYAPLPGVTRHNVGRVPALASPCQPGPTFLAHLRRVWHRCSSQVWPQRRAELVGPGSVFSKMGAPPVGDLDGMPTEGAGRTGRWFCSPRPSPRLSVWLLSAVQLACPGRPYGRSHSNRVRNLPLRLALRMPWRPTTKTRPEKRTGG